ncbi:fatty acid desaturase [Humisphaera borealis]|uniref:Fatty acid desaturase n=2 Tax=Humisphaera borealis TaxID=2807512 RepID=A0A7M2WPB4_9BACT|nr:fatty acid desaturase [Humisphaera borealis]
MSTPSQAWRRPPIRELGTDLLRISPLRRAVALACPFLCFAAYFFFAAMGQPVLALLAVVVLSFLTYGSVSHDLVHANLGLPRALNRKLLSLLELLMLRSGTVYRIVHLNHHAKYPDAHDDPEGAAARFSLVRTLFEGIVFQFTLGRWACRRASTVDRRRMTAEWFGIATIVLASLAVSPLTLIPLAYCALVYAGSWIIPLVTSYLVHRPEEDGVLRQTRLFRGTFYSMIALDHLYHLEHHLYPQVPHQNWKRLARRLDPHFREAGVEPQRVF